MSEAALIALVPKATKDAVATAKPVAAIAAKLPVNVVSDEPRILVDLVDFAVALSYCFSPVTAPFASTVNSTTGMILTPYLCLSCY